LVEFPDRTIAARWPGEEGPREPEPFRAY